ncbi:MAG: glycerol-3-phosphate 1-O-acyltransferase PlsY [Candidatus Omnitrophica bacterium]|nr:glycerol-3-phosphate 1-O-acyltransferase PlsY [Candidatus Omnitrophota bacterium]
MIVLIIAVILSYLLGSIPMSYIIARITKGVDIRKYGSGNVGATNVLRTAGRAPAAIALIGDILKGVISVTVLAKTAYPASGIIDYESFRILLGLSVICGHIWPVFLRFKGGKGVATSTGVLLVICPKALGIAACVWLLTVIITKYVSLGSLLGSISLPIITAVMGSSIQLVIFTITLCIISSYKHKSNIIRLINGEESKIGQKISS